jgi:hypothetical protein
MKATIFYSSRRRAESMKMWLSIDLQKKIGNSLIFEESPNPRIRSAGDLENGNKIHANDKVSTCVVILKGVHNDDLRGDYEVEQEGDWFYLDKI